MSLSFLVYIFKISDHRFYIQPLFIAYIFEGFFRIIKKINTEKVQNGCKNIVFIYNIRYFFLAKHFKFIRINEFCKDNKSSDLKFTASQICTVNCCYRIGFKQKDVILKPEMCKVSMD